ncbi:MAG: protein kinase [Myxococcales bacterium]|nr:protein kinase [Myxococcales bacterium]
MADDRREQHTRPLGTGRKGQGTGLPGSGSSLFEGAGDSLDQSRNSIRKKTVVALVEPGQILEGKWRWQIGRRLGKGGFGAVFLARRLGPADLEAPFDSAAIKVFHTPEGLDPKQMLKRELAALLALKSERIPAVYDWSLDGDLFFVAMQFFPKGSLWDITSDTPRLKPGAAWTLLLDLLAALKDAHHASLLHLDVKPGNVLIADKGGFVLTDFGVAQSSFASRTTGIAGLGTTGYQAPEQARKDINAFDARTDLFGVGTTVWSRVTGIELSRRKELLSLDADSGEIYALPPPSQFNRRIPKALEEAIMALLPIDPVERPGGAAEAHALVRRLLSGHRDAARVATDIRGQVDEDTAREITGGIFDPLWQAIAGGEDAWQFLVRYDDGTLMCREGERSYHAFALLKGTVRIERGGRLLATEGREGTFLGEVSTLTGGQRTASMRAQGEVWTLMFNAAELEQFVTSNPALGIRMIKSLAERLERESSRRGT